MRNHHGDFVWYELVTPDPAGARNFYQQVAGLSIPAEAGEMPGGMDYRMITAPDGEQVGGMLTLTTEMAQGGARPTWLGYVEVDDVDGVVARAQERGGRLLMPPAALEGIGRMALLADPQGAPFYVFRSEDDEESRAYRMMVHGHVAWNELTTDDAPSARSFYYELFGWTDGEAMEMGELGTYQMFDQNGQSIGA